MAQWIKQNDSPSLVVGPFVSNTDGFTAVTDATASDFDTFEAIKHGDTSVTALDTDQTFGAILGFDGFYHLSLTTDETDTLGLLTVGMQDNDAFLPVRHDYMVVEVGAYGALITGTDVIAADVSAIPTTNIDSSDVQAELVAYDAIKGTEGAWASDVAALNNIASSDVQAELVTYDAATGTELAALNDLATSDIWDALSTDYAVATSFGAYLDAAVSGVPTTNLESSDVQAELVTYGASTHAASDVSANVAASDVWDNKSSDFTTAGTFGLFLDQQISTLSLTFASSDTADIADAVWDEATTDHVGAGSFGLNLDAQLSTVPTTNIDSSDVQAELVTYDAATGTELAALNDLAAADLNNLAASDIQAELVTYDAATGTEVAALNDLASSDIWDAKSTDFAVAGSFGLYLDTQLSGLNDLATSDIAAELATYDAATGTELAALNDLADTDVLEFTLETGYSVKQSLRLISAALAGKSSGGGTTSIVFRDLADGADRITATVDSDGDRTAMTLNP